MQTNKCISSIHLVFNIDAIYLFWGKYSNSSSIYICKQQQLSQSNLVDLNYSFPIHFNSNVNEE